MLIVSKNLEIVQNSVCINGEIPKDIKILADTEFTQKSKMIVDVIGVYSPNLDENSCYCFFYDELNDDFNPIFEILKLNGYELNQVSEDDLDNTLLSDLGMLQEMLFGEETNAKSLKKLFDNALNNGYFDNFLNQYNLSKFNLRYKREHKISNIYIELPKINIKFEFFFAIADLFKIWGKNHQELILNSQLNQYRSLKVSKPITLYVQINGKLHELAIILKDSFYRIPPLSDKSLNGNARALGLEQSKLNIKNNELARQLGLKSDKEVIENFNLLRLMNPDIAAKYNAQDIFLSDLVSNTQQKLLDKLRDDFGLNHQEIADTTGSTVSKFILDCLYSVKITENYEDDTKLIKELLNLTKIKNLQEIQLNDFGIQPFLTVGGLLYTRTSKYPVIRGNLSDCDLSSCYATFMSQMSIYLGEPVIRTFKYKKYKPTMREIVEFINNQNINRDAWFIRVSGELKKAFNTLVMSDLRFTPKSILCPTVKDLNPNKKSVELFNAFKTPKKQAVSTLLLKQIKFGLINADILDCLKLLPANWYEEYLDLQCDCVVYFPTELIAENLNEVLELRENLPVESYIETFNAKNGIKNIETQYYKNNVALKFDIGKFWKDLKSKRAEYKKQKNPIQEIFKLVGNSGYGVLACLHLSTNNLVASNMITAGARSATWLMTNALNGFAPITDGTSFNWDTVPVGMKFKDILENNPNYIFDYCPNTKSNLDKKDIQSWLNGVELNNKFKQHLYNFYDIDENHIPANKFGFELKEEYFYTKDNVNIKTIFFTNYHNTNAGNYSKGMDDSHLLINDTDYDFNEQNNYVKARSFNGKDCILINWYLQSVGKKYESPIIYSENKVIKFGDGNKLAIKLLESGVCKNIAHPMGFSTKMFKMMKLISRSQFLFLNECQLKNFETNEFKLSELSNHLFTKSFWSNLTNQNINDYGAELIENIDYYKFSRTHAVGIGFELLALSRSHKGSIESVRNEIFNKIISGCNNFNASLNVNRNLKQVDKFKYLLASIIVLKANAEFELIECLKNSANEPTVLSLNLDNIQVLNKIWEVNESD